MKPYETFKKQFNKQITRTRANENKSVLATREDWGLRHRYIAKGVGNVQVRTYFRFCIHSKLCPVENLIELLKPHLNPQRLIAFIHHTYELEG